MKILNLSQGGLGFWNQAGWAMNLSAHGKDVLTFQIQSLTALLHCIHYHWIGLRENLQETMVLYHQIWGFPINFPLNQSHQCTIILHQVSTQVSQNRDLRRPEVWVPASHTCTVAPKTSPELSWRKIYLKLKPQNIQIEVSFSRGTPKSSILVGCSLINHP